MIAYFFTKIVILRSIILVSLGLCGVFEETLSPFNKLSIGNKI